MYPVLVPTFNQINRNRNGCSGLPEIFLDVYRSASQMHGCDIYIIYNTWQKNIPLPFPRLYGTYIICVLIIERYYKVYNILLVDVCVSAFLEVIHDTLHISNCFHMDFVVYSDTFILLYM